MGLTPSSLITKTAQRKLIRGGKDGELTNLKTKRDNPLNSNLSVSRFFGQEEKRRPKVTEKSINK